VKLAKSILSQDRDNLYLWDGYARLEQKRGNIAAARSVYETAVQYALTSGKAIEIEDELDLWTGWTEMEYEQGDEARCLEVLVLSVSKDSTALGG
jgi:hypothetical protein